jgi:peptidoglycan/xylan/chitin deacetylase (PgdA/CDA1 family)
MSWNDAARSIKRHLIIQANPARILHCCAAVSRGVFSIVRGGKAHALEVLRATGTYKVVRDSRWRARRLLILCYHGISLDDEHEWDPALYMPLRQFESRLDSLIRHGYHVLPLTEALDALRRNTLPPRSVTLTFDDGTHDFYEKAYPALAARNLPVTVYLTTYYCAFGRPVFNGLCSYLLWKGRHRTLSTRDIVGVGGTFDLSDAGARQASFDTIVATTDREAYSAGDKQGILERLAAALDIDYEALARRRMFHIMTPEAVRELADRGVDFQLHTHRHRTPLDRELFHHEIEENRAFIERITDRRPTHFCYPSGHYCAEFAAWLQEQDVHSATTCDPGLATASSSMFVLPRFVDTSAVSPVVFEGWLAGVASWLPRKRSYAHG